MCRGRSVDASTWAVGVIDSVDLSAHSHGDPSFD